jgi:hypothetical protein
MVQNKFNVQTVMVRCAVRGGRPQDRKTTGKRPENDRFYQTAETWI